MFSAKLYLNKILNGKCRQPVLVSLEYADSDDEEYTFTVPTEYLRTLLYPI